MKRMRPIYGWTVVLRNPGPNDVIPPGFSYVQFGYFTTRKAAVNSYCWSDDPAYIANRKYYRPAKIVIREIV